MKKLNIKLTNLIENCDIIGLNNNMKMVKNASLFKDKKGIVYIKHYDTIIFAYDLKTKICEIDKDCSPTSNKQIGYALNYFDLTWALCINIHEGSKMNYSGEYV